MYSRVTLFEIDTVRTDVAAAVDLFKEDVLPQLHGQEGYAGVVVLANPDGQGMIVSVWETAEAAARTASTATEALQRHVTLFRSPPGREEYEIAFAELPTVALG